VEHVSDGGEHGLTARLTDRVRVEKHGALSDGSDHAVIAGPVQEFLELLDAVKDHAALGRPGVAGLQARWAAAEPRVRTSRWRRPALRH
jgi:hypothetical protein